MKDKTGFHFIRQPYTEKSNVYIYFGRYFFISYFDKTFQVHHQTCINSFPHDKILDQTKLKAFADDKLNVTKMIISVFDRAENIAGKGEIACTSNFFFSHNVFKRLLFQRRQNVSLCGNALRAFSTYIKKELLVFYLKKSFCHKKLNNLNVG